MSTHCAGRDLRPLAAVLTSDAISLTGNVVCLIALPLYVLATTGSVMKVGIVAAAGTLPVVLGGALGVVVDKVGYRRVSVLADVVGAVTMAAIPLLHRLDALPFGALVALVFATGVLDTPGQAARTALMPEAAAAARVPLERAMGWHAAVERGSRLVGAPLAGFLVAAFGAIPVLVIDAFSFVASAAVIVALIPKHFGPRPVGGGASPEGRSSSTAGTSPSAAPTGEAGYWSSLRAAVAFTARSPILRSVVIMVLLTNALDAGKSQVILPAYSTEFLGGARDLGLLVGAFGAGSLIGALAFSAIGLRLPRRWTYAIGFLLCGGPTFLVFAARPGFGGCLVAMVVAGLASGAINPILGTVMLTEVPPHMRASVNGLVGAGCWAAMPLGAVLAGALVEQFGLVWALTGLGVCYLAITLWPFVDRTWAALNRHEASRT